MKTLILTFLLASPFLLSAQYKVASTTTTPKKTTVVTKYSKGYVVKKTGHRKEGEIQLKVVNGDTVEIRVKVDGKKSVYTRSELRGFGLVGGAVGGAIGGTNITRADREKFQPGFIVLNGRKMEGKVAVDFKKPGEPFRDYFVYSIKFQSASGSEVTYDSTSAVAYFSQTIHEKAHEFHKYGNGYTVIMRSGKILLAQNPYSTSKRENLSKGLGELSNVLAKEVGNEVKGMNTDVYHPEYLVKGKGENEFNLVKFKSYEKWLSNLFAGCQAYREASGSQKREIAKFKDIRKAVDFFNKRCEYQGDLIKSVSDN